MKLGTDQEGFTLPTFGGGAIVSRSPSDRWSIRADAGYGHLVVTLSLRRVGAGSGPAERSCDQRPERRLVPAPVLVIDLEEGQDILRLPLSVGEGIRVQA
jgi:hypothetical protein